MGEVIDFPAQGAADDQSTGLAKFVERLAEELKRQRSLEASAGWMGAELTQRLMKSGIHADTAASLVAICGEAATAKLVADPNVAALAHTLDQLLELLAARVVIELCRGAIDAHLRDRRS
jgi:hypothetical protein